MDYQGNYFPEEHDENESKVYRTVKGVFKWTMYGISFIIYGIIIFLLIANSDSDILETNYFADLPQVSANETDDIVLYRINTKVFMNDLGSLQLYNVDYAPEFGIIEIGIKFNAKKLTNEDYGDCLEYVLTDSNGNKYDLANKVIDSGGRYGFSRICFKGVSLDLDSNDLRYHDALDHAVKPVFKTPNSLWSRSEISLNLAVYRKSDGALLYDFNLYDNTVTFNSTEYEN